MAKLLGPAAEKSFNELLADQVNEDRPALILSVIEAFKQGEPAAIKLVTQALLDTQFSEEMKFPISDDRFKEIICAAADHIRTKK